MNAPPIPVRVLVVDDDPMSRDLLAILLAAEGYSVHSADSGDAALALLASAPFAPHLVLTDVQMPGLSGNRLAAMLRHACGPDALLLAMSGSGPDGPLLSGFDGFLMKPFRMEDVAAALEHAGRVSHVAKVQPARKRRKSASSAASPVDAPGTAIPSPKRVIPSRSSVLSAPLFPASSTASLPTSSRLTDSSRAASNSRMDVLSQPRTDLSKETQGVPSAVPLLDERIYEQLADSMPVTQLHQMYALCLKDARERVTSMRRLVSQQDQVQFVRQAHTIKGGCGMLGASELYAIATRLEAAGVQAPGLRDTPDVNPLDELSSACDRLERMLDARALASNLSGTDQPEQ